MSNQKKSSGDKKGNTPNPQNEHPDVNESSSELKAALEALQQHQEELEFQIGELQQSQDHLEESRGRFYELFHNAPVGYITVDSKGLIHQANHTFVEMLKTTPEALSYKPLSRFLTNDSRDIFLSRFNSFFRNPENKQMELAFRDMEKQMIFTQIEGTWKLSEKPEEEKKEESELFLIVRDITWHKVVEKEKLETESRFQYIFDQTSDAIFLHDLEGRIFEANETAVKRLGYSREELNRMTPRDVAAEEIRDKIKGRLQTIREKGSAVFETVHMTKSGARIPTEVSCRLIRHQGRDVVCTVARDLSERLKQHEQMRKNEERFRLLAENMPVMINAINAEGTFSFWNRKCEEITGYSREEMLDNPQAMEKIYPSAELRNKHRSDWQAHNKHFVDYETELIDKSGKSHIVLWTNLPPELAFEENIFWAVGIDVSDLRKYQDELVRNRDNLETTLRSIGDAVITTDTQTRIVAMNPIAEILTGWTEKEAQNKLLEEVFDITNTPSGEKVSCPAKRALEKGRIVGLANHTTLRAKDGKHRQIADSAAPIENRHGLITGVVLVFRDVTEEYRVQEELHFQSRILNQIRDMVIATNLEGHINYVNNAECEMLGHSREEMIGKNFHMLGDNKDIGATQDEIMQTLKENGEWRGEVANYTAKNEEILLDARIETIYDEEDNPLGYVGVSTDITARKKAEAALKQSEERLESILNSIYDAVFSVDLNSGELILANAMIERIFGRPQEDFYQNPKLIEEMVHSEDAAQIEKRKRQLYENLEAEWTYRIVRPSGEVRWVSDRARFITDASGKGLRIDRMFTDITDHKKAEEEREKLNLQIQQTQKLESLGVMAGGIAHDFNNILMAILGHSDLALTELPAMSPARESIREIESASRQAADLCRQMLAYSGKASIVIEEINLAELVSEMAHLLKTSISKKAILNLNIENDILPVNGDASQIRQIVMNLIINASEAIGNRSGSITITTGITKCDKQYLKETYLADQLLPGTYVHLEVSDTGCGMDAETQQRIFEPFFTTKFTGRGLGLAAVLGIVKSHHGAMKLYSEHGKGTTFKILLPALLVSKQKMSEQKDDDASWRGKGQVLLVDDEPGLRALGQRMLKRLGFEVLTAEDGRQALDLFREKQDEIACILLDLTMPHMDGVETYQELRRINPRVQVVLASGYSEQDISARFAGKGLAGVIQKPYDMKKLRTTLRKAIERAGKEA
ncbi:MAG: PAS domain S-box protein [Candidatus Sumerlaeia bacterium]